MRNLTRNLLLLSFSVLLSLVALEGALHIYFHAKEGYWLFKGQDNFTVQFAQLVRDDRVYSLRPNSTYLGAKIGPLGFRESPPPPKERPVVCVLGDSVPFGAGAGDKETLPYHLKRLLDAAGYKIGVVNAAIPSYTINQSYLRWRIDVRPRYDCKLFVISAANDATLMLFYKNKWKPTSTWAERNLNMKPARRSALLYFLDLAADNMAAPPESGDYLPRDLAEFRRNMKTVVADLASVAPVILLPITACYYTDRPLDDPANAPACDLAATNYKANAEQWGAAVDGINKLLRAEGGQPNVTFLDTAHVLNEAGRTGLFVDGMHFSDKGARIVADYLFSSIRRTPELERSIGN